MTHLCTHTAHSRTWWFFPSTSVSAPWWCHWFLWEPHSHGAWQRICPTEPPVDIPGHELRAVPPLLEAEWVLYRGLAFLPRLQTRAWDSGLKVDFLHSWAKCFQPSSQMFLYMVLAVIAWDRARIWPDSYTEKLDGMLGWCHPIIKEVVSHIGTPLPSALGVPPKGRGAWVKVGVSSQSLPGLGWRREGCRLREGGRRRKVLSDWKLVPDGAGRRCSVASLCTCVATRGLPGYAHCFTSVS